MYALSEVMYTKYTMLFFFFKENSEEMTRTEKNDRFKRQKTETYIRILALSSSED